MWGMIILGVLLAVAILVVALNFGKIVESFRKLQAFSREVALEMQKVTWPTQEEVINSTILVVVVTIALTAMCWLMDLVIGQIIRIIF